MKTLVRILAQVFENYGTTEKPRWKAKSGQEFTLMAEADFFLYEKEQCVEVIGAMLKDKSSKMLRYEFLDLELVFTPALSLDEQVFETRLLKTVNDTVEPIE